MLPGRNNTMSTGGRRPARTVDVVRERLADEAFERYLDWRDESAAMEAAYSHWLDAPAQEKASAFTAYAAALDREECAARHYQTHVEQAERLLGR